MDIQLVATELATPEDRAAIVATLTRFNESRVGPSNMRPLALLLKDAGGETLGGLWGRTGYDWMFIELLAVPEALQGRGLGAELMRRAEAVAVERGCAGIWLDTFSFQARPFYEKLGYTLFGEISGYPRGGARYFLHKRLETPSTPA
ncbi:GNAT family N-acetyltransferase [Roseomonas sp. M0104]|uniref:GNAT family N-acetyltransferase n=1 Tax=Teichococcus coralli TaxID=2545983 RepID=A0A845BED0_9PROT|nr:GNAT family N-acetyltransferase [Pseudoroseomonas coralli]MXP65138.1 GNAT family N-acetyltransferase [Pseudoroseomonas coralli]